MYSLTYLINNFIKCKLKTKNCNRGILFWLRVINVSVLIAKISLTLKHTVYFVFLQYIYLYQFRVEKLGNKDENEKNSFTFITKKRTSKLCEIINFCRHTV